MAQLRSYHSPRFVRVAVTCTRDVREKGLMQVRPPCVDCPPMSARAISVSCDYYPWLAFTLSARCAW